MLNMKNRLAKRIMAFVLSGAMIVSGLAPSGITAYAAETSTEITEEFAGEPEENDAGAVSDDAKEETPDEDSGADAKEESAAEDVNKETSEKKTTKENASTDEAVEEAAESVVESKAGEDAAEEAVKEEENKATPLSLSADHIDWINITQDSKGNDQRVLSGNFEVDGFIIKTSDDGKTVVDKHSKTIDGKSFSQRIKLGGKSTSESKIICFTTDGSGTLTVYGASASSSDTTRTIDLYNSSDVLVESKSAPTDPAAVTFAITDAGSYYVGGFVNAINIYGIDFIGKSETPSSNPESESGSDPGNDPDSEPASSEPDSEPESSEPESSIPDNEKHTVWVVGDSTVCSFTDNYYYPRYGYGTQLQNYLDGYYEVNNLALSGRSSKSFTTETNYTTLKTGIKNGDILIVGFGHNDSKTDTEEDKAQRYTSPVGDWQTDGSFAKSLYDNYVKIAHQAGATTIICTPIVRRTTGTYAGSYIHETSEGSYPEAIRQLGTDKADEGVYVADLTTLTKELYERLGNDETLYLHAWTKNAPGSVDNTHINIYGAKVVAQMLAEEISKFTDLPIAKHVKNLTVELTKDRDLVSNPNYTPPTYTPPAKDSTLWEPYGIFKGSAFGSLGKAPTKELFTIGKNEDEEGTMHLEAHGNGKLGETENGIIMYYYRLPSDARFTLEAKATVNRITSNGQVGFGLMARDNMFIDTNDKTLNGDYVVAGTLGTGKTNCFYYKDNTEGANFVTNSSSVPAPAAGDVYNLSITFNGDGYACTFGDNPTQSGGFDFTLTSVDEEYQYIGMFVSRDADITFSDIHLTVNGEVKDIMDTTTEPTTPEDPGPSGDDDLSKEGNGGEVSVTDGLSKDKKYGYKDVATFVVLDNMPFKTTSDSGGSYAFTLDGKEYTGCVQGNGNGPSGTVPSDGTAAFKITAKKDSKITFIVRQNKKNYYFIDGDNPSENQNIVVGDAEGGASRTFYMKKDHTYYFYAGGSKVMVAAISIAESGSDDEGWNAVFGSTTNPSETESGSEPDSSTATEPGSEPDSSTATEPDSEPDSSTATEPGSEPDSSTATEPSSEPGSSTATEQPSSTEDTKIPADTTVKRIALSNAAKIKAEAGNVIYAKKKPYAITVTYTYEKTEKDGSKKQYQQQLTEGLHYDVITTGVDLTAAGEKTVTIKGTEKKTDLGIFIGERTVTYKVIDKSDTAYKNKDIAKLKLSLDTKSADYKNDYITPTVKGLEEMNAANYKIVYKNNINVGKASVVVIGQNEYYGSKELTFSIKKADLTKTNITMSATNVKGNKFDFVKKGTYKATDPAAADGKFVYKGSAITFDNFKITLDENGKTLRPNQDYTIDYKKNAQAGKATLTVKGANNFSGNLKIEYEIAAVSVKEALEKVGTDANPLEAEFSDKGARLTQISFPEIGVTLKENTDYKVTYSKESKSADVGLGDVYTVKITAAGSYKKQFEKKDVVIKVGQGRYHVKAGTIIDKAKITKNGVVDKTKLINAGKITDASGRKVKPEEVEIDYSNPRAIVVKPSKPGVYADTTLESCRIAEKLSGIKLDKLDKIANQPFDGVNSVTLTEARIQKYLNNKILADDIRIVSYKNNNKVGSASVTIEGKESGQYYGTRNLSFKIAITGSDRDPGPEDEETEPTSGGGSSEENPGDKESGGETSPSEPSSGDGTDPSEPSSDDGTEPSEEASDESSESQPSTTPDPETPSGKKIDVWDFGVKQEAKTDLYRNNITASAMSGKLKPDTADSKKILFNETSGTHSFGDLTMNFASGDRVYADPSVTDITTSDGSKITFTSHSYNNDYGDGYTAAGGWYSNGARDSSKGYVLIEKVQAGDKIIVYAGNHNSKDEGSVTLSFELEGNAAAQSEPAETLTKGIFRKAVFIAKQSGTYKVYQSAGDSAKKGKPMYNRIVRIPTVSVSGTIDSAGNDISGCGLRFINQTDRSLPEIDANLDANGNFTAELSAGYTYRALLTGTTELGFVVKNNADKVTTTEADITTVQSGLKFTVETQETYTYSGKIEGFADDYDKVNNLEIDMTPTKDFDTNPVSLVFGEGKKTFSAELQPNVRYVLEMTGVNDYQVKTPTEICQEEEGDLTDQTITVELKPMYEVTGGFIGLGDDVTVTSLTFTNVKEEGYVYNTEAIKNGSYSISLRDGEYLTTAVTSNPDYATTTHIVVDGGMVSQDLLFTGPADTSEVAYAADIYVGYPNQPNNYATVNAAVDAASRMKKDGNARTANDRVTIHIAPGTYREQVIVNTPYISFVNDTNEKVLITWYYGIGYVYYSADKSGSKGNGFYNAENAYDKYEKNGVDKWGTSVYLKKDAIAFRADGITFENSFNRYVTDEEIEDGVEPAVTYTTREVYGDTSINFDRKNATNEAVNSKSATERATVIVIEADLAEFNNCGFFSSQDTVKTYEGTARAYFKNCVIEGQTDYIFGGGSAVFDACELSWKGYDAGQSGYITACKVGSASEKGYLFRNCTVTANNYNNLDVAAGYYGRPWGASAPTVFINTKLKNKDMIVAEGWKDWSEKLAKNAGYKEYGTISLDGTEMPTADKPAGRVEGTVITEEAAKAINVSDYFGSDWTPAYYTADAAGTVAFSESPRLTDNGDINVPQPGHTLTVNYKLNEDDANNDASIIRWYIVENAEGGNPQLDKTSTAAVDKTYKIPTTASGKYIKVEVTPETIDGRTGTPESVILKGQDGNPVGDSYVDPSTGSDITLGDGINIFLAGDSTVKDYSAKGMWNGGTQSEDLGSWGEYLQSFFDTSEVTVQNFAQGGRSSRSFINDSGKEAKFSVIEDSIQEGDYLFIQFGHNDSSVSDSKADVYTPIGTKTDDKYPSVKGTLENGKYPNYYTWENGAAKWLENSTKGTYCGFLQMYVDMAWEKGAIPVIMSPVARMQYNSSDKKNKTHHADDATKDSPNPSYYWEAAEQVYEDNKNNAEGKAILFIDTYELTTNLFNDAYADGEEARGKEIMSISDGTHNNKLGGMVEAMLVAEAIQNLDTPLAYAVKTPTRVSGVTTTNKTVFSIDSNGGFTAYEQKFTGSGKTAVYTGDTFTTTSSYWTDYGTTKLASIRTKAGELADSNVSDKFVAAPKAQSEMSDGADGTTTVTVTLTSATPGATIYYTDDGVTSPKNSDGTKADGAKEYTNAIVLTKDTTIKAFATATDKTASKVVTFKFSTTPNVAAPTANKPTGSAVASGTKIELTAETGAEIRYTMGGSNIQNPTVNSSLYNAEKGLTVTNTTTIKAIAIKNGVQSEVATFEYIVSKTQTSLSSLYTAMLDSPQLIRASGE